MDHDQHMFVDFKFDQSIQVSTHPHKEENRDQGEGPQALTQGERSCRGGTLIVHPERRAGSENLSDPHFGYCGG